MLPVDGAGQRFCLFRPASPAAPSRGGIVYAHPFAEEMNKSRRAVAVAAGRLALAGWSVLQVDFEGCGDSSGDIADARWEHWQDDLGHAARWLAGRGVALKILWGLRLGALVASSVIDRLEAKPDLLFWQPVVDGSAHLTQFLRLKAAEHLIAQSTEREGVPQLKAQLKGGTSVQVAGYSLNPALAVSMDAARLSLPQGYRGTVHWLETGRGESGDLLPASVRQISALQASGVEVKARAVAGAPFWQTVEIEECPSLVDATLEALALPPEAKAA